MKNTEPAREFLQPFQRYARLLPYAEQVKLGREYRSGRKERLPPGRQCPKCDKRMWSLVAWRNHHHYVPYYRLTRDSQEAYNLLVYHNVRLVASIAVKFQNRGLDLVTLIEEGMDGLLLGLERWDPERGFAVSTYITHWIRQTIQRAIASSGVVRIPEAMFSKVRQVTFHFSRMESVIGHPPSVADVAKHLKMKESQVRQVLRAARIHSACVSISETEATEYRVSEAKSPDEQAMQNERLSSLHEALQWLDAEHSKTAYVLRRRFDLTNDEVNTLTVIGKDLGLSRERVRQLEKKGLLQLKAYFQKKAQGLW